MTDDPWAGFDLQPAAAPKNDLWGGFDLKPAETAKEVPDVSAQAPGWIGGAEPTGGTDIGNALAEGASKTAFKAMQNVPGSALEFGKNMVQPFLHPVDTYEGIKNLGMGVLEKTHILSGNQHEKYADAVGKFFADRYGGIDAARKTLEEDPVGMAGDLSMLLTGGGGLAARAPGVVGKVGETAAAVGRGVDPLRATSVPLRAAGEAADVVGSEMLGHISGAGPEAVRTAASSGYEGGHAGRIFRENMRGNAPLEGAVNEARGALAQLREERGTAYRTAMEKMGLEDAALGNENQLMDFNKIDAAVKKVSEVKNYKGQDLSPETRDIRGKMTQAIDEWKELPMHEFHTVEGMDALKQKLGNIRDATDPNTPARVIADQIYHGVRQSIVDQAPGYARIMKGYEEASTQIREIEKTLALNPKASIDTALRKLQSALRNNVNTSFGRRAELVDFLTRSGAPHLMERLAGQTMHSWTPRGLSRFVAAADIPAIGASLMAGHPMAALGAGATLPLMSPRIVGETTHAAARVARRTLPVARALARPARAVGEIQNSPYGTPPPAPYQQ